MKTLFGLIMVLVTLGCVEGTPTPSPTPLSKLSQYDCADIATSAKQLTEDEVIQITDIYRLHMTVDTPTLRECEGRAEWSHGERVGITIWTEVRDDGLWNGYELHEPLEKTLPPPDFAILTPTLPPAGDRAMVSVSFVHDEIIVFTDTTFDAAAGTVTVVVDGQRYVNEHALHAVPDPRYLAEGMSQFAAAANETGYRSEWEVQKVAIEYSGGRLGCEREEEISRRWLCTK